MEIIRDQISNVWKYKKAIYFISGLMCVLLVYSFFSTSETSIFQIGEDFIRSESNIQTEVGDVKNVIRNTYGPDVKIGNDTAQIPFTVRNFDNEEFKLTLYFKRVSTDSLWTVDRYIFN